MQYIKVINTYFYKKSKRPSFSKLIFIKKYNIIYIKKKGKKRNV